MSTLYFRVQSDWQEVLKLREQISKLKTELKDLNPNNASFDKLNDELQQANKRLSDIIQKAAEQGAEYESKLQKAFGSFDLSKPSEELAKFDKQVELLCENLDGYFEQLKSKLQNYAETLNGGSIVLDNAVPENNSTTIEELKQKNAELTKEIKEQIEAYKKQQEQLNQLVSAIKSNNIPALRQFSQTATDGATDLREKIKEANSDIAKQAVIIQELEELLSKANSQVEKYQNVLQGKKSYWGDSFGGQGEIIKAEENLNNAQRRATELRDRLEEAKNEQSTMTAQLEEYEEAMTNTNQKVSTMRSQISNAREMMAQLINSGQTDSDLFKDLAEQAGEMRSEMAMANAYMQYFSNPNKELDALKTGLQGVAGAASLFNGVLGLMNVNSEKAVEIQTKLQSLLGIIVGLETTYNAIRKESNVLIGISVLQHKAAAAAEALENAAKEKGIALTTTAIIKQKAFNMVAKANPYVLLATAIISVVGALALFSSGSKQAEKEQERLNRELEKSKLQLKELNSSNDFNLRVAEAAGAGADELRRMRFEAAKAANELAYLNMQKVLSDKNATKEQKDEAIKTEQDTWDNWVKVQQDNYIDRIKEERKANETAREIAQQRIKEQEEEAERIKQLKQKLADEIASLEEKNQQSQINLMQDGLEKRLAQLDLDYQKEVQAIDKQREALAKEQGRELTDEESEAFNQAEELAFQKYQQGVRKEREQAAKEEQKAMDEYLAEYGRYFEKREAIQRQYEDKMKNAGTEGELLKLQEEQKKALDELDETLMNDSELWSKYFSEFSSRSSASIRGIITDIEELIDYMNGVEGAEVPDIFKDNENTVKAITEAMSDPNALQKFTKGLNNQIKVFKKMLDKDNPFKMISDGFRNKDADSLAKGFEGIGQAASQLDSILRDLGVDSDSTLGKVTDALSNAASYASQGAQLGGAWGAAAGAALGIATSIVGSIGADYSSYNRLVEQYDSLIDVWDELIDRKKEYISMSWGDETLRATDEAIDLIGKETDAWKELGRARLNAGSSVGSHSIGVRMSKNMTDTDWQGIARALGTTVQKAQDMLNGVEVGGRMQGLFNLSAEQLKKLQEEAPAFWAKMDEDVRKYLQGIMDGVTQIEEVNKLAQEQLTQISFESMYDNFVSELMNMEATTKDAANNISETFMQAMLSNRIGEMYREKLKSWYDKFANSMEGGLTTDEMSQLREEYLGYVKEALEERNTLAEITGYKNSFSQSASSKSWGAMSQETGEELNGRFTALQEYGSQINQKEDIKISQLNLINATMTEIRGINVECRDIASDARDMMAEMFLEVREINEHTGDTVKCLKAIQIDITEIKNNTK